MSDSAIQVTVNINPATSTQKKNYECYSNFYLVKDLITFANEMTTGLRGKRRRRTTCLVEQLLEKGASKNIMRKARYCCL